MDTALLACSVMQAKSLDLPPWQPRPYSINIAASLREPFGEASSRKCRDIEAIDQRRVGALRAKSDCSAGASRAAAGGEVFRACSIMKTATVISTANNAPSAITAISNLIPENIRASP
jgi:hypothetical protein